MRRRILVSLVLAAVFGVAMGLLKGDDAGLRGGIGNLSAPWLLVPLLAALGCRSLPRGAAVGLAASVLALVGFYATLTADLAGHLGGGGYLAELRVETGANAVYFAAGVVTGPGFGMAGAWIGRRRPGWLWPVLGALLAAEIGVVALAQGHRLAPPPFYFSWGVADWRPYIGESLAGLAVLAVALWRRRSRS